MYIVNPYKCYVVGAGAVGAAFVANQRKQRRLKIWIPVTGNVQNISRGQNGECKVYIRFTDKSGQLRTAKVEVADDDAIGLGSEVDLSYNPLNPEDAFVRDAKDLKLSFYIPVVAGIVLIAVGVVSQITLMYAGH
jgi:hypothetical protein